MNKIKPLDRQSLIDVALQTSGSVEGALGMSIKNDIPVSGELAPDVELETAPVVDKLVLGRYEARGVRPATDISAEDLACVPYGGIGFMGIEIDFYSELMARTIAEIKDGIAGDFMRNEDVARAYGFEAGDSFTAHFSKASVESVLFYIFACAAWIVESLFDEHRREVNSCIEEILPHRPKWYRDKVLAFMKDKILVADTDYYDTAGMSDADIEAARVVKYAAATESSDASLLTIKVAGENGGVRQRLDGETETQLAAYIAEFKDAGVRIDW